MRTLLLVLLLLLLALAAGLGLALPASAHAQPLPAMASRSTAAPAHAAASAPVLLPAALLATVGVLTIAMAASVRRAGRTNGRRPSPRARHQPPADS